MTEISTNTKLALGTMLLTLLVVGIHLATTQPLYGIDINVTGNTHLYINGRDYDLEPGQHHFRATRMTNLVLEPQDFSGSTATVVIRKDMVEVYRAQQTLDYLNSKGWEINA